MKDNITRCLEAIVGNYSDYDEQFHYFTCRYCKSGPFSEHYKIKHRADCVVNIAQSELDHDKWIIKQADEAVKFIDDLDTDTFESALIRAGGYLRASDSH